MVEALNVGVPTDYRQMNKIERAEVMVEALR